MPSVEERLASVEADVIELRQRQADTQLLAAHADAEVAEFRREQRAHTQLLNATRLDMADLRDEMTGVKGEVAEIKVGIGQIVSMLQGLTGDAG